MAKARKARTARSAKSSRTARSSTRSSARSSRASSRSRSVRESSPKRYAMDCRLMASERNCQMYMSGPMDDLIEAAARHAASAHGHDDNMELREELRSMARPERR